MSYILDALRKSDQQRRQGGVPTLPAVAVAALSPERPALSLYGPPVLVLILAVVMTINWVRSWPVEPAMIAAGAEKPREAPLRQAAPSAVPSLLVVPPSPPVASPAAPLPEAPAVRRRLLPATATDTRLPPPGAGVAGPRDAALAMPEMQTDRGASMASADMPLAIRQQIPPLVVAAHLYSSKPRDRLVSINGRTLREGDSVTPELVLEQITPEGMSFAFRGYRFQRNAQ